MRRTTRWAAHAGCLALVGAASSAHAAGEIWRNDWFLPAPPTPSPGSPPIEERVVFGANGDVIVGGLAYVDGDYQFTRVAVDGTTRETISRSAPWIAAFSAMDSMATEQKKARREAGFFDQSIRRAQPVSPTSL